MVAYRVTDIFGIVGSAYMDALDLFPAAGIRFIPTVHEQGAGHMADGYSRVSGRHGVCIAQNGPGITNIVTSTTAAYWAHSPLAVITSETGSATIGLADLQDTEQLPIFSKSPILSACFQTPAHSGTDRPLFDMAMGDRGQASLTYHATISMAKQISVAIVG